MKRIVMILLMPLLLILMGAKVAEQPAGVQFYQGNLESALLKAQKEGKLVFVDFYANWCAPCKLMDEYTFTDAGVAEYMKDKYIPIKMNIDDFEGFSLKNQYNIKMLPTLLVLNCNGKEIERKEEGLIPSNLKTFLGRNFVPKNICDVIEDEEPIVSAPSNPKPVVDKPTISKPNIPTKPTIDKPTIPTPADKPTYEPSPSPAPSPTTNTSPPPATKPNLSSETGLFKFNVDKMVMNGYSVQMGGYEEYGNVLREIDKFQIKFPNVETLVFISKSGNKTMYKVLLGHFNSRESAVAFQSKVKKEYADCFIKNLSQLK